jgi:hypothetical protein
MAYALFNSGAAAAYANSFRQRQPYGNWADDIKSDIGKETLGKIPFYNFQAELAMAKQGLEEYGATKRQIDTNEASRDIAEMRWGDQGGTPGGNAKKAALARLMSGTSGAQKRGGTSGITSQTLLNLAGQSNESPLGMLAEQTSVFTGLDRADAEQRRPYDTGMGAYIKNLPGMPAPPNGGQLQVQPQQTPQLQTPAAPQVDSKVDTEVLIQEIFKKYQTPASAAPTPPATPGGETQ